MIKKLISINNIVLFSFCKNKHIYYKALPIGNKKKLKIPSVTPNKNFLITPIVHHDLKRTYDIKLSHCVFLVIPFNKPIPSPAYSVRLPGFETPPPPPIKTRTIMVQATSLQKPALKTCRPLIIIIISESMTR